MSKHVHFDEVLIAQTVHSKLLS